MPVSHRPLLIARTPNQPVTLHNQVLAKSRLKPFSSKTLGTLRGEGGLPDLKVVDPRPGTRYTLKVWRCSPCVWFARVTGTAGKDPAVSNFRLRGSASRLMQISVYAPCSTIYEESDSRTHSGARHA